MSRRALPVDPGSPSILPVPALATTPKIGGKNGVTTHARDRWAERVPDPHGVAVRRAWALGVQIPEPHVEEIEGDEVRYDPLAGVLLVRKDTAIVTVLEMSVPSIRDYLKSEGAL